VLLLERREFLQGQRIHRAQQVQRPFGGLEPLLLLGAHIGPGRRRGGRFGFTGGQRARRHEHLGAVLGHQQVGLDPELLDRPTAQGVDPQALFGPGHLVAVHRIGEFGLQIGQVLRLAAHLAQFALQRLTFGIGCGPGQRCGRQSLLDDQQGVLGPDQHGLRRLVLPRPAVLAGHRLRPRLALGGGRRA